MTWPGTLQWRVTANSIVALDIEDKETITTTNNEYTTTTNARILAVTRARMPATASRFSFAIRTVVMKCAAAAAAAVTSIRMVVLNKTQTVVQLAMGLLVGEETVVIKTVVRVFTYC